MSSTLSPKSRWDDYRQRRRRCLAFWGGGFLGLIPVTLVAQALAPRWLALGVSVAYVVGYFAAFAVLGYRWVSFPCPRCGLAWFSGGRRFQRTCVHCGLPMWAEHE